MLFSMISSLPFSVVMLPAFRTRFPPVVGLDTSPRDVADGISRRQNKVLQRQMLSVVYYICLYFLVHIYSKGDVSLTLKIMLLVAIPFQILHGTLLFYGALESKIYPLEVSLWLSLVIASYNTVLGTMGFIYFIRTGNATIHFLLAVVFLCLAFSLFTVLCHDVLMIYAYKKIILNICDQEALESDPSNRSNQ